MTFPLNFRLINPHHLPRQVQPGRQSLQNGSLFTGTRGIEFDWSRTERHPDGSFTGYKKDGSYLIGDGKTYGKYYNSSGQITSEWTKNDGTLVGKDYDLNGRVICLQQKCEDENGKTISNTFTSYKYGDNDNVVNETLYDALTGEETVINYDEGGVQTGKILKKGAVTTYYDADDKPIRCETNKGQGIVVTEDLTE